jgi:ribonuclease PH
MRIDGRGDMELRRIEIKTHVMQNAYASVSVEYGKTRVFCTAMLENGVPPFMEGMGKGWLTAEYAMLPASCPKRKVREKMKVDGRSMEIQRLIGRSLRSILDFKLMGEVTIYIDCDVVCADGGTRTASITGAFVALCLCVERAMKEGIFKSTPIINTLAAVSAGIVDDKPILDLCYIEDSRAQADMNMVATEDGGIAEIQISGEERTVTQKEFATLVNMCKCGIQEIIHVQKEALGESAHVLGSKYEKTIDSDE